MKRLKVKGAGLILVLMLLVFPVFLIACGDEQTSENNDVAAQQKEVAEKVEYLILEAGSAKQSIPYPAILFNQNGFLSLYEVQNKLAIQDGLVELVGACLQGIETEDGFQPTLIKTCDAPTE